MNENVTGELLAGVRDGDAEARAQLWQRLYGELRRLAAGHLRRSPGTIEPTALVHEVFVRLAGRELQGQERGQFLALASMAMRSVLVDAARRRQVRQRDERVSLDKVELAAADPQRLDRLLAHLEAENPELAQVAALRCFGLETAEVAAALGFSEATVKRRWRLARAWLARELGFGSQAGGDPA